MTHLNVRLVFAGGLESQSTVEYHRAGIHFEHAEADRETEGIRLFEDSRQACGADSPVLVLQEKVDLVQPYAVGFVDDTQESDVDASRLDDLELLGGEPLFL